VRRLIGLSNCARSRVIETACKLFVQTLCDSWLLSLVIVSWIATLPTVHLLTCFGSGQSWRDDLVGRLTVSGPAKLRSCALSETISSPVPHLTRDRNTPISQTSWNHQRISEHRRRLIYISHRALILQPENRPITGHTASLSVRLCTVAPACYAPATS
jgi:hypothetical protein